MAYNKSTNIPVSEKPLHYSVEQVMKAVGYTHRSRLRTSLYSVPARLPQPCTVRHLLESYLDLAAVPRRSFFELLFTFSTNELEQEKLAEFSSMAGQEELLSYCHRPRRTALEVTG